MKKIILFAFVLANSVGWCVGTTTSSLGVIYENGTALESKYQLQSSMSSYPLVDSGGYGVGQTSGWLFDSSSPNPVFGIARNRTNNGGSALRINIFNPSDGAEDYYLYCYNTYATRVDFFLTDSGSARMPIAAMAGGGTWGDTSDERLKKNILNLSGELALQTLLRLRPVTFEWRNPTKHNGPGYRVGLIAQEVEAVCPELVRTVNLDSERDLIGPGPTKMLQFDHAFFATSIAAMQEMQREIASLNARLITLETK